MGVNCLELTGDNEKYNTGTILTTPEKFDAITRYRIKDGGLSFFGDIALVLLDEVHLLNDPRGAALEAIVSRMKMLACKSEMKSSPLAHVRFLAISATIPNMDDLAEWLMVPREGIKRFGEEMRPVKLTTKVLGYTPAKSDFLFEKRLQHYVFGRFLEVFSKDISLLMSYEAKYKGLVYRYSNATFLRKICTCVLLHQKRSTRSSPTTYPNSNDFWSFMIRAVGIDIHQSMTVGKDIDLPAKHKQESKHLKICAPLKMVMNKRSYEAPPGIYYKKKMYTTMYYKNVYHNVFQKCISQTPSSRGAHPASKQEKHDSVVSTLSVSSFLTKALGGAIMKHTMFGCEW